MNTNPNAVKILCYGDSNTWGQKPDKSGRYASDIRWTGVLQKQLGEGYYIVEEGLSSRTTDLDYARRPGRNGKTYLIPCLVSHTPLDVVVVMLGTNDLKIEYDRTAEDIATAIKGLVNDIRDYAQDTAGKPPKVLLVSPILIDAAAPRFAEFYTNIYDERSMHESQNLAAAIAAVAEQTGSGFVDAASVAGPGEDGIHFSQESETPFATFLRTALEKL